MKSFTGEIRIRSQSSLITAVIQIVACLNEHFWSFKRRDVSYPAVRIILFITFAAISNI